MDLLDTVRGTLDRTAGGADDTAVGMLDALLRLVQHDGGAATAAGAAAAGSAYGGWRALRWLAPLAVPLYARLRGHELTRHPKRAALLALLRERPGLTTRDLVVSTRMNQGTILHHLRALERGGLVRSKRVGRERAWADKAAGRLDRPTLDTLREPMRARIVEALRQAPGLTQRELARALGLSPATVSHHLGALKDAGLVTVRREGVRARCFAAPAT